MEFNVPSSSHLDTIILRDVHLSATFSSDAWNRPSKPQPLIISISLSLPTIAAASTDNIADTFSYSTIYKAITSSVAVERLPSLSHLTSSLASTASDWPGEVLHIVAKVPKAILRAEDGLSVEVTWERKPQRRQSNTYTIPSPPASDHGPWRMEHHAWVIKGLRAACVIGVNAHERLEKQIVVLDVRFAREGFDKSRPFYEWDDEVCRHIARRVCETAEASGFLTVEALVEHVAQVILNEFGSVLWVKLRCEKPSALAFAEGAGVEIVRYKQKGT